MIGEKIASLTMSAVSSNFRSHFSMHSWKSAISLSMRIDVPTKARSQSKFRSGRSVRPMHLFGLNCDHDYYFELLGEEERDAQSITRCSSAHHRDFRAVCDLSRRCTRGSSPADGRSVTETTMRAVEVVMLEPGRELLIAFLRVEVMANVGPRAV